MREAAALVRDDAVVRVLGRVLRQADAEGRPLLRALEDEVGAAGIALLHAAQPRPHVVLLAYPLLGPFDRGRLIARVGFHPILVIGRPLALARDGDPEPVHIEEDDTSFVIDWKGNYRIEGPAFIYSDRQTRRVSTILGYPTHLLAPPS